MVKSFIINTMGGIGARQNRAVPPVDCVYLASGRAALPHPIRRQLRGRDQSEEFIVMDLFDVLNFVCGLAMFLFGMSYMGDGLESCAGGRLQSILEKLTSSPARGFLLGAVVTAIIQSSSATSVMVVGFVNSGVMTLQQAIGLIMGANVGTTVTGWLVSLTSIDGASMAIQLLKPSSWVPVLALVGVYFMNFEKSGKHKNVAAVLLGFAILMVGMDTMSSAVEGLKEVPAFTDLFSLFSNPIVGILVGALVTAVMQSSSASVGVLQALSMTGSITLSSAIPLVLGMNIGAAVPVLLSAISANKEAKRTSLVYLYFNLISTILFMIVYELATALFPIPILDEAVGPVGIALFHTIYKLVCAGVLLPFTKQIEKLVCLSVRDAKVKEEKPLLDDRLMNTPAVALAQAQRLTVETALMAQDSFNEAVTLLDRWDDKVADHVRELERTIDTREDILGTYLVKLSALSLSATESQVLSIMLHTISDFERISDHAVGILLSIQASEQKPSAISSGAKEELKRMAAAVSEALGLCIAAFSTNNPEAARRVEPLEEVVDDLADQLKNHHIDRLRAGKCSVDSGFIFTDLISDFGRVSDHCSNIAACLVEMQHNSFDTHQYVHTVHHSGDADYLSDYEYFSNKYAV